MANSTSPNLISVQKTHQSIYTIIKFLSTMPDVEKRNELFCEIWQLVMHKRNVNQIVATLSDGTQGGHIASLLFLALDSVMLCNFDLDKAISVLEKFAPKIGLNNEVVKRQTEELIAEKLARKEVSMKEILDAYNSFRGGF